MADIEVYRRVNKSIHKVMKRYTLKLTISISFISWAIFFYCLYIFYVRSNTDNFKDVKLSLLLGLVSGLVLFAVTFRAIRYGRRYLIADDEGLRLRPWPEIGAIPWKAVIRLEIAAPQFVGYGVEVLVARLKYCDFIQKINPNRSFLPGSQNSPPFGTIAGRDDFDLHFLKSILEEFHRQKCN